MAKAKKTAAWFTPPSMDEILSKESLTYPEAAALLGVSERKLWALAKAGQLPHYRVGTAVRFWRRQLEEWVRAGGTAPNTGGSHAA